MTTFNCPVCRKEFSHRSHLVRHVRIHDTIKRLACPICPRRFTEKHHLTSHLVVHKGLHPHACTVCKRTFSEAANLARHVKTHRRRFHENTADSRNTDPDFVSPLDLAAIDPFVVSCDADATDERPSKRQRAIVPERWSRRGVKSTTRDEFEYFECQSMSSAHDTNTHDDVHHEPGAKLDECNEDENSDGQATSVSNDRARTDTIASECVFSKEEMNNILSTSLTFPRSITRVAPLNTFTVMNLIHQLPSLTYAHKQSLFGVSKSLHTSSTHIGLVGRIPIHKCVPFVTYLPIWTRLDTSVVPV